MTIAPISPILVSGLSDDESRTINLLSDQLVHFALKNHEANAYYEARHKLEFPGVTIPAAVASRVSSVVGAPATVVDVLDERLDFLGWDDTSDAEQGLGLDEVYDVNELDSGAPMAHLDALIFGTSFARVGSGDSDVPLVTVHPPTTTTGERDRATRRLVSAWTSLRVENDEVVRGVLDLPDVAITVERVQGRWRVVDRDEHKMGRVPVVQFVNRPRSSRLGGRSEITPAIRSLTEGMMRATLGMSVNTMFYSIPQLMILGRGSDAFVDRDGNPVPGWKILAGHALGIDKDDDGDVPTIHQLSVASPAPFIEQLRDFRAQVASEAGMPADYMGIQTSNPSSADAILRGEVRLVKRTQRRQSGFGRSWMEVARLALMVRDGSAPDDLAMRVEPDWQNAETPTQAATADAMAKYIASGVIKPESQVVRKRMGLSRSELRTLEAEDRAALRAQSRANISSLAAIGQQRTVNADAGTS